MASSLSELYEAHAKGSIAAGDSLIWNGIREHIDRLHKVCSWVHNLEPESILDLACNFGMWGNLFRWNHQSKKRIVGVDIAPSNIEHAVHVNGYDVGHIEDITTPFNLQEKFDLVLVMEVLEHIHEGEIKVLENAKRHCKKNLIVTVPVEDGDVDGEIHVRKVNPHVLEGWIRYCGFRIVESSFVPSEFGEKPHWVGWHMILAEVI